MHMNGRQTVHGPGQPDLSRPFHLSDLSGFRFACHGADLQQVGLSDQVQKPKAGSEPTPDGKSCRMRSSVEHLSGQKGPSVASVASVGLSFFCSCVFSRFPHFFPRSLRFRQGARKRGARGEVNHFSLPTEGFTFHRAPPPLSTFSQLLRIHGHSFARAGVWSRSAGIASLSSPGA